LKAAAFALRRSAHAVAFEAASRNRIHGITAVLSSDRAINLINGSNANRIDHNTSADNRGSGLRLIASDYNVVVNNTLTRNVIAGMGGFTAHHTLFRHNVVIDNGDNGIFWADAATDNRIEDNRISDNPGIGSRSTRRTATWSSATTCREAPKTSHSAETATSSSPTT